MKKEDAIKVIERHFNNNGDKLSKKNMKPNVDCMKLWLHGALDEMSNEACETSMDSRNKEGALQRAINVVKFQVFNINEESETKKGDSKMTKATKKAVKKVAKKAASKAAKKAVKKAAKKAVGKAVKKATKKSGGKGRAPSITGDMKIKLLDLNKSDYTVNENSNRGKCFAVIKNNMTVKKYVDDCKKKKLSDPMINLHILKKVKYVSIK